MTTELIFALIYGGATLPFLFWLLLSKRGRAILKGQKDQDSKRNQPAEVPYWFKQEQKTLAREHARTRPLPQVDSKALETRWARMRPLRKVSATSPRSLNLTMNRAKIVGELQLEETASPLRAPLTGRPCAAYHLYALPLDPARGDYVVYESQALAPFQLRCGDATLSGDPQHVEVLPLHDQSQREVSRATIRAIDPALEALLDTYLAWDDLEFHEGVVEIGAQVSVLGGLRWVQESNAAQGYREGAPRSAQCTLAGEEGAPLLLSNDPLTFS